MSDKLTGVGLKIERAKKHVSDLDASVRAFFDTSPYKIGAKRDPDTRRLIYYVESVEPTPSDIPLILGEIVQSLRSALDQLAYQLWLNGSRDGRERRVYFPAFDAPKGKADFSREIQSMGNAVVDAFDAIEPHKGGKGHYLWVLSELNNADKHRLLITVGSAYCSADLGAHTSWAMCKAFPDIEIPIMSAFFTVADSLCPLKAGDELFIDMPDSEFCEHLKFTFAVAVHEPGIIERQPILPAVHQLTQIVDNTVAEFAKFL